MENTKNDLKQWKDREYIEMIKEYNEKVMWLLDHKSEKVRQEVLDYIEKNGKKKRETLYQD